jgi:hypothetical protein
MFGDYVAEFGDTRETPDDSARLRLPSHRNLQPPLADDELFDVVGSDKDKIIEDLASIRQLYKGVKHPVLDSDEGKEIWNPRRVCHNALYKVRQGQHLSMDEVFALAERLITWAQEDPAARLGPRKAEDCNWFILPPLYKLYGETKFAFYEDKDEAPPPGESPEEQDSDDEPPPDKLPIMIELPFALGRIPGNPYANELRLYKKAFDKAKFTVHFIEFEAPSRHWGVIIYRPKTGNSWFIDSGNMAVDSNHGYAPEAVESAQVHEFRSRVARGALLQWLRKSKRPAPKGGEHHCWASSYQRADWSSGIHAIANALAFIRFEAPMSSAVRGWAQRGMAKAVRKQVVTSLHNIMGLYIDPDFVPEKEKAPPRSENPPAAPAQVDDSHNTPAHGEAENEAESETESETESDPAPSASVGARKPIRGRRLRQEIDD